MANESPTQVTVPQKPAPWLLVIALLAVAYFATGSLGLSWAVETGFATPIWPPSGIALGAILLFGYRVWPGVFIGSVLANVLSESSIGPDAAEVGAMALVAAGIAGGASLQAIAGGFILRRFGGFPNALTTPSELTAFFFLAGPVACLISPTIGTMVLVVSGSVGPDAWLASWANWWSGDTLGVVIFTPMILVWGLRPKAAWIRRRLPVTALLLATFVLASAAFVYVRSLDKDKALHEHEGHANDIAAVFDLTLKGHLSVLTSLEGFFSASDLVTPEEFREFTAAALAQYPGVQALSWNIRFPDEEREAVELAIREYYGLEFGVKERDDAGNWVPAATRPEYVSVLYIEPREQNSEALGFDPLPNPARRVALNLARDTGAPVATGRITLVQETGDEFGFLVFRPHYRNGMPTDTVEDRQRYIEGYHTAVFRTADMINSIFAGIPLEGFDLELRDLTAPPGEQLLYATSIHGPVAAGTGGDRPSNTADPAAQWTYPVAIPGREWELHIAVLPAYLMQGLERSGWLVFILGLIISALLGVLTLAASGRESELAHMIATRTDELEKADRTKTEILADLRENETRLKTAQQIAQLGNWDWDVTGDELWWSDEICRILRRTPEGFDGTNGGLRDIIHPDDRAFVEEAISKALHGKAPYSVDYRIVLPGGEVRYLHEQAEVTFDDSGKAVRMAGILQDITDRMRAEGLNARLGRIIDRSVNEVYVFDSETLRFTQVNLGARRNLGYTMDELRALTPADIKPEIKARDFAELLKPLREGETEQILFETTHRRKDGSTYDVEVRLQLMAEEAPPVFVANILDITERKRSEQALRESEARYRAVLDNMIDTYYRADREGRIVTASPSATDLLGYSVEELIGQRVADFYVDPEEREKFLSAMAENDGEVTGYESALHRKDGRSIWVSTNAHFVRGPNGEIEGVDGTTRDVTERKRAEEALRESEERYRAIFATATVGIGRTWLKDGGLILSNKKLAQMFGYDTVEEFVSDFVFSEHYVNPDDRDRLLSSYERSPGKPIECAFTRRDGSTINLQAHAIANYDEGILDFVATDVTEQRWTEEALRESEERFRAVVDNLPEAILLKDLDGRFRIINKRFEEWYGLPQAEALGKTSHDIYPAPLADALVAQDEEVQDTLNPVQNEHEVAFTDGTVHNVAVTRFPVLDSAGTPIGVGSITADVTRQKQAEAELRQSHKMEALGQLTGGIAHEFNNLLMAITGNLEILRKEIADRDRPARRVETLLKAAFGGAELTERLLAYTGKQMLRPKVVDVGELISDTAALLGPVLGEKVRLGTDVADDLWPVKADSEQLKQCLIELAINARDEITDGGVILYEAANVRLDAAAAATRSDAVEPGDYVRLSVADTGSGMTPEVAGKAFDPFFTTKDVGEGTGLGLSMVYGFVTRESGGTVDLDSTVGMGTTVTIHLPAAEVKKRLEPRPERVAPRPATGKPIVLLVEDAGMVRDVTAELLEGLGYEVFAAADGEEALALAERLARLTLVLSDVVMPGDMNGVQLVDTLRESCPAIDVILMSGYPDTVLSAQGVHMERIGVDGIPFLRKPFQKADLEQALETVLEAARGREIAASNPPSPDPGR